MTRRVRLISGCVLFAYVATHLTNHSLGLISLSAMEAGREWFLLLWRNPLGTAALYGALGVHFALGLWALYRRRSLRMPAGEAAQLVLGLMIVPLLAEHVLGTRLMFELFDVKDAYTYVVLVLWYFAPEKGALQAAALITAWVHGCIGLYYWLRLRRAYPRLRLPAFAVALLVPVLALLGFVSAGREVAALAQDAEWLRATMAALNYPGPAARAMVSEGKNLIWAGVAVLVLVVLIARLVRAGWQRRRGVVRLRYP